jgi:hypothetical protein
LQSGQARGAIGYRYKLGQQERDLTGISLLVRINTHLFKPELMSRMGGKLTL